MSRQLIKKYWPLLLLTVYFSLFFFRQINFTTSDLGRHLTNGKVIIEEGKVFASNFYSYTHPDFPAVNHHWLFGVIVFAIERASGFAGLTVFNALVASACFGLSLWLAVRKSSVTLTSLAGLVALPLVTYRLEVRPEIISYLLLVVFYAVLTLFSEKKLKLWQALAILIPSQIIWTNVHLFFIYGWLMAGIFWLEAVVTKKFRAFLPHLTIITTAVVLSSLLNPQFIKGALQPLQIFDNYGYMVAENQSIHFLWTRFPRAIHWYYLLVLAVVIISKLLLLIKVPKKIRVSSLLLTAVLGLQAWLIIRNIPLVGFVFIPVLAQSWWQLIRKFKKEILQVFKKFKDELMVVGLGVGGVMLILMFSTKLFTPNRFSFGAGLIPRINDSVQFVKDIKITGPIFNNYDIGGYLIYHFYPQESVFVDNRPEAYPAELFTEAYIPAQENEDKWSQLSQQYGFNLIYFYRHDITPWAQPFLIRRIKDPSWVPIYVDEFVLVLIKNTPQNQQLIEKYAIDEKVFSVS